MGQVQQGIVQLKGVAPVPLTDIAIKALKPKIALKRGLMSDIMPFEGRRIRTVWDETRETWLFSVVDAVAALTDSLNPQTYWRVLKKRMLDEGNQTVTNCNALKMKAADGKMRLTDVGIIQSIPSPKPSRSSAGPPTCRQAVGKMVMFSEDREDHAH